MQTDSLKKIDFNTNIHGLRGLAALFVLMYHIYRGAITAANVQVVNSHNFWPSDLIHYYLSFFLQSLNSGIEIFFMISGYLITSTLLHLQNVKQFAINRCLRVYPAFLATQVLMFTIGPIIGWSWMANLTVTEFLYNLLINILFLPGVFNFNIALGAAWTLSFEAMFYIISATIFSLSRFVNQKIILLIIIILSIAVFFFYPVATFFIPGIACYFIIQKWPEKLVFLNIPLLPTLTFGTLITALSLPEAYTDKFCFLLIVLVGLISFMYIVRGYGFVAFIMRTRLFQFLGSISYSLYLWQVPIMFPIKRILLIFFPSDYNHYTLLYSFTFCSLTACILFSYISYKIFEEKIPAYIKRKLKKTRTS